MELNIALFNETDWILLVVLVSLLVWGMARGFNRVFISLLLWLVALLSSQILAALLQQPLSSYITDLELALLLPFVIIFVFLFILMNIILSLLMLSPRNVTSPLTRLLGGVLSVPLIALQCIFVLQLARLLALDDSTYWLDSQLVPYLEQLDLYWNRWLLEGLCNNLLSLQCRF